MIEEKKLSKNTCKQLRPDLCSDQEKTWAIGTHLAALAGIVATPLFGNVLGPLIVWLLKRKSMPLVDQEGKKAINFQISITLYFFALLALLYMFSFYLSGTISILALIFFDICCIIRAAVILSNNRTSSYPLTIGFLR